jgi:hypothetical protein
MERVSAWSPDVISRSILIQISLDQAKSIIGSHQELRQFLVVVFAWAINEIVIEFIDSAIASRASSRRMSEREESRDRRGGGGNSPIAAPANRSDDQSKGGGGYIDDYQRGSATTDQWRDRGPLRTRAAFDPRTPVQEIIDKDLLWSRIISLVVALFGTIRIYTMSVVAYTITELIANTVFVGMSDKLKIVLGLSAAHTVVNGVYSVREVVVSGARNIVASVS